MQAVAFALTGSDNAEVTPIARADCVFRNGKFTYYLNNIHVDRVRFQKWRNGFGLEWVFVQLRGDDTVVEYIAEGMDLDDYNRPLLKTRPDLFEDRLVKKAEWKLEIETDEFDRVIRAWEYVYAHGCIGKTSPF